MTLEDCRCIRRRSPFLSRARSRCIFNPRPKLFITMIDQIKAKMVMATETAENMVKDYEDDKIGDDQPDSYGDRSQPTL